MVRRNRRDRVEFRVECTLFQTCKKIDRAIKSSGCFWRQEQRMEEACSCCSEKLTV